MSKLPPAFEEFAAKYPRRTLQAGRTLLYQSEIPRSGYILTDGILRVYSLDINGEESNITFLKEDAIVPIEFVFEKTPSSLYYYSAATDIEVAAVPIEDIRREVETNVGLQKELLAALTTKYVGGHMHIQALEQTRAVDKIIHILQYLVLRFGKENSDGTYKIDLALKQHDIANMVGVTRETAATELGKLKKANVISYSSFYYTVDMDALGRLVGVHEWEDIEIG